MRAWHWMMAVGCVMLSACSVLNLKQPPASVRFPTTWHFQAKPKVLLYTGGNDVTLQPSTTGQLDVMLLNNQKNPPTLVSSVDGQQLTLNLSATDMLNPKNTRVVVSLPNTIEQLVVVGKVSLKGMGQGMVQTTALPNSIRQLAVQDLRWVSLQGQPINLRQLIINRVAQIQLQGVNSANLELKVSHSGPVKLTGVSGLSRLSLDETGPVSIAWVNSRQLNLDVSGKDRVFLAGTADVLIGHVSGKVNLDAKYLRTQTAFIETKDTSRAQVTVLDSLNAYARDQSNIYYYHLPKLVGRYYQGTGTVLYMGDKAPPCLTPECPFMPHDLPG